MEKLFIMENLKNSKHHNLYKIKSKNITLPFNDKVISDLKAGDIVYLNGIIYTARDAAHKRLAELIKNNGIFPFNLNNSVIFYAGPCPARDNQVTGAIGPTTSSRLDSFTLLLIENGLKATIGKGKRSNKVKECLIKYKAVYFAAFSGTAALIKKSIVSSECIAFHELGTEAIYKLQVNNLKLIVANDIYGNDIYEN